MSQKYELRPTSKQVWKEIMQYIMTNGGQVYRLSVASFGFQPSSAGRVGDAEWYTHRATFMYS